ncbi:MAG: SMI1/KNR4 family protein [Desulfomonile tiedjei]|nr:SMI1/KNR4 family protein [Desulfomonile tiedjei]
MTSRKEIIEEELGVKVPEQYAVFLDKYGIFYAPGIEIYGISDTLLGYDGLPCVIGATQIYRRTEGLPHRFLVIQHTGLEDEMICLDTEDEKVYSLSRAYGKDKVADSFDEWFQKDIIEYLKERDQKLKRSNKEPEQIIDLDWLRLNRDDT